MSLDERLAKWPKGHRRLLVVCVVLLIVCAIYGFVFLYPAWRDYDEANSEYNSVLGTIQKSQWPGDSERMRKILEEYQQILSDKRTGGFKKRAETVLSQATGMFDTRIRNDYGSVENFVTKASQTEYKDQFDRLDALCQGLGVVLDPAVYGMDETTAEPNKYQMILKLWMTEEFVSLAREHKLFVARNPRPQSGGRGQGGSLITVLPVTTYKMDEKDKDPYLLEFSVKAELLGSLENVLSFISSLQTGYREPPMPEQKGGKKNAESPEKKEEEPPPAELASVDDVMRFMPVVQMELRSLFPSRDPMKPNAKGELIYENVRAVIVCSTFFRPTAESVKVKVSPSSSGKSAGTAAKPIGI